MHWHRPRTHCWPGPQASPFPQLHAPLVQPSAVKVEQATHACPARPQEPKLGARHAVPLQQPGQVASHTQPPSWHCCPAEQEGPDPHWQVPASEQVSASPGAQEVHAPPPTPHALTEGIRQLAPAQHPPSHVTALQPLQTPLAQVCTPGQAAHAEPAVPQAVASVPGRHAAP